MATQAFMIERDEYRVVLVLPMTRQILGINDCGTFRLPRISIPKWTRPAEELTGAIDEQWHIRSAVIDFLTDESKELTCAVMEVRTEQWKCAQVGLIPVEAYRVNNCDLSDREQATLEDILTGDCGSRGPFSRLGWVDDAQEWIKSVVHGREVEFTDQTRQLNACGTFALVRFGTKCGPAYWLKAVGKPNSHEFTVTTNLARNCPKYLAKLVCARTDWNAWVMEEVGEPLRRPVSLPQVEQVVTRLAEMQKQLAGRAEELLSFGCMDHRIEVLEAHMHELFVYLEEAMERQTSTKVYRIDKPRLRELEDVLRDACCSMRELGIPDSLIHNDLNPGNILSDGSQCVFADWCEACVGNPFLIFQQLCGLVSRDEDRSLPWAQGLKLLYKSQWHGLLSESQIDRAFIITPLLAVLSCLFGRGTWLRSSRREDPHFQGYTRSLARYMDRAAHNPRLLEALWH
jgi:hypothetical protein